MKKRRTVFLIPAFILALGAFTSTLRAGVIDQSAENADFLSDVNAFAPMGQSFVPTFSGLDFVELNLTDNSTASNGVTGAVRIRESSIAGAILGTSNSVFLEDCFNFAGGPGCGIAGGFPVVIGFDFAAEVSLTPGATYVLEPFEISGDTFSVGRSNNNDVYAPGTAILDGIADPTRDLWFREGLSVVPEPTGFVLLGMVVLSLLVIHRRQWHTRLF